MNEELNQRKAKTLIRDYLRETGRKGVTSLLNDIRRHTGDTEIFQKRTIELWLSQQNRFLQEQNWVIVQKFIQSEHFKKYVPYANESPSEKRLITVAEGLVALYCERKRPDGVLLFPSKINSQGVEAVKLLKGNWESPYNLEGKKLIMREDQIDIICKIEPVPEKRYAKIAYIHRLESISISASGIAIYLRSKNSRFCKYIHVFALQLWRRKDPATGSLLDGELSYFLPTNGPVVFLSNLKRDENFNKALNNHLGWTGGLSLSENLTVEENEMLDIMLEDVLPHGFTET